MWEDGALMSALRSSDEKRGSLCRDRGGVEGGSPGTPGARLDAGQLHESKRGLSHLSPRRAFPALSPSDLRKRLLLRDPQLPPR